jgi:hypothetical protein
LLEGAHAVPAALRFDSIYGPVDSQDRTFAGAGGQIRQAHGKVLAVIEGQHRQVASGPGPRLLDAVNDGEHQGLRFDAA